MIKRIYQVLIFIPALVIALFLMLIVLIDDGIKWVITGKPDNANYEDIVANVLHRILFLEAE